MRLPAPLPPFQSRRLFGDKNKRQEEASENEGSSSSSPPARAESLNAAVTPKREDTDELQKAESLDDIPSAVYEALFGKQYPPKPEKRVRFLIPEDDSVIEVQPLDEPRTEVKEKASPQKTPIPAENIQNKAVIVKRACRILMALVLLAIIAAVVAVVTLYSKRERHDSHPSEMPSPSPSHVFECFESSVELQTAVDFYLADRYNETSVVALTYGFPMNQWCVDDVQDFSTLFSTDRNPVAASFNEPIGQWNLSSATSLKDCFRGAAAFDQAVNGWDVRRVRDMSRIFQGAASFNRSLSQWNVSRVTDLTRGFASATSFQQDLCNWAKRLPQAVSVKSMFRQATSCETQGDPDPVNQGPFCFYCNRSSSRLRDI